VTSVTGASVHLDHEIRRGPDRLFAMTCTVVCIGRNGRPTRLPPAFAAIADALHPPATRIATTPKMVKTHAR